MNPQTRATEQPQQKILLMGPSGSGKSSMRTIIFADNVPNNCRNLTLTVSAESVQVKFMGDLYLNLWDCGGQNRYMDDYFNSQKSQIFSDVAVLIYVFDIRSEGHSQALDWFSNCITALNEYSPSAKVFCLLHKMDLVSNFERSATFESKRQELQRTAHLKQITCFPTTIWDETLYTAWSEICTSLLPGLRTYQKNLNTLMHSVDAKEVVLFERRTFLTVAKESRAPIISTGESDEQSPQRYEKVGTVLKQLKLSSAKLMGEFCRLQVRNKSFSAFMSPFTSTTLILVIMDRPEPSDDNYESERFTRMMAEHTSADTSIENLEDTYCNGFHPHTATENDSIHDYVSAMSYGSSTQSAFFPNFNRDRKLCTREIVERNCIEDVYTSDSPAIPNSTPIISAEPPSNELNEELFSQLFSKLNIKRARRNPKRGSKNAKKHSRSSLHGAPMCVPRSSNRLRVFPHRASLQSSHSHVDDCLPPALPHNPEQKHQVDALGHPAFIMHPAVLSVDLSRDEILS